MDVKERLNGVAIGLLMGFRDGAPLVVFPANARDHAIPARSLTPLSFEDTGSEVALLFEDGDLARPLIIGRIVEPRRRDTPQIPPQTQTQTRIPAQEMDMPHVLRDGETVKITAGQRIELRVGQSAIIMDKDGRITIRGQNLVSHAARSNRLRGGSIDLN